MGYREKTKADVEKEVYKLMKTLSRWLKSDEVTNEAKNYIRIVIYKLSCG